MSKLEDMLVLSRKLAAESPQTGDRLLWSAEDYSEVMSRFLFRGDPGQGVSIDPPSPVLDEIMEAEAPCYVVWSARTPDTDRLAGAPITSSRRKPTDLRLTDEFVDQALGGLQDLHDVQALVASAGISAAQKWVQDGACGWIAASFLMNTLDDAELRTALAECKRVLTRGGVFRCIVLAADEPGSECPLTYAGYQMQRIPLEIQIAEDLAQAGFHGMTLTELAGTPILTSGGAELRLFGAEAFLGTAGICLDQGDAAVYLGPWKSVEDDDGHTYPRGVRIAVCEKTAGVLERAPYAGSFLILKALDPPAPEAAPLFDCSRDVTRDPGETKGRIPIGQGPAVMSAALDENESCGPGCDC